jgi:hypothetical protein
MFLNSKTGFPEPLSAPSTYSLVGLVYGSAAERYSGFKDKFLACTALWDRQLGSDSTLTADRILVLSGQFDARIQRQLDEDLFSTIKEAPFSG